MYTGGSVCHKLRRQFCSFPEESKIRLPRNQPEKNCFCLESKMRLPPVFLGGHDSRSFQAFLDII